METISIRVLVVDDYEPWRRFHLAAVQKRPELQIIREATDGIQAVQQAQEMQPDLILLDIGLPILNGIEAARQIRSICPASKILFVSENRSRDIMEAALNTGALGYVLKSDAVGELSSAIEVVLKGKRFISASLMGLDSKAPKDDYASALRYCHEVAFYSDDAAAVDGYARFIESGLKSGSAVVAVVTESHRANLIPKLEADGVDVSAAIEQGSFIPLDALDVLSRLTVNDAPDPVRCAEVIGNLIIGAANGITGEHRAVVVCGEIAPSLLSKGNADGAIQLNTCGTKSRESTAYILCVDICRVPFPTKKVIQSSGESALNTQPFMEWDTSRPLVQNVCPTLVAPEHE